MASIELKFPQYDLYRLSKTNGTRNATETSAGGRNRLFLSGGEWLSKYCLASP
jgi:hypothetical protein